MHGSSPCFIVGNFKSQVTLGTANHLLVSGQVTRIHQPGNQGISPTKASFWGDLCWGRSHLPRNSHTLFLFPRSHRPCQIPPRNGTTLTFQCPWRQWWGRSTASKENQKIYILLGKLTWNPKMEVWKMSFLFISGWCSGSMLVFRGVIGGVATHFEKYWPKIDHAKVWAKKMFLGLVQSDMSWGW